MEEWIERNGIGYSGREVSQEKQITLMWTDRIITIWETHRIKRLNN